ncbi:MmcQ/YjbR family DNA-binding protein [Candidatus Binatus sp.]|uniref:MmcQ/YjbR family DNA-binding protein n=1 Tax=Candidatus Binatus sp. TaxID=2811406 RepID=UPI003C574823
MKRTSRKSPQPKPARRAFSTDVETLRRIALSFPGIEEGTSYGTLAFRVGKKFICRMKEDGESLAIRMEFGEREILVEGEPETFYFTEHYRNYPMVLVRLPNVHPDELKRIFGNVWRKYAGKRLIESSGR